MHYIIKDVFTFEQISIMNQILKGEIDGLYGFPILDVLIFGENGRQVRAKAIVDTGAAHCCLQQDVIDGLELQLIIANGTMLHPIDGVIQQKYYKVYFELCDQAGFEMPVAILHSVDYPAAMILGVSFLKHCKFIYNHFEKTFELNFNNELLY